MPDPAPTAARSAAPRPDAAHPVDPPVWRVALGGFLMGLANLVPGVSGGTMILALGLYDRFIGSLADLSRLRITRRNVLFVGVLVAFTGVAIVGLAGPAVWFVTEQRTAAYALFVGLTLGGAPQLWRLCGGPRPDVLLAIAAGLAAMLAFTQVARGAVEQTWLTFALVGAAAMSSMILPGISGSLVLLIFGMYETVFGAVSALKHAELDALRVLVPVGVGAALGLALLSNVLKVLLFRFPRPSHGLLLGLLLGSVGPLWPWQVPVDPDLAHGPTRDAIELVVLDGAAADAVRAEHGDAWTDARVAEVRERYAGLGKGDLKERSLALERRAPDGAGSIALAVGLLLAGFGATRLLGRHEGEVD